MNARSVKVASLASNNDNPNSERRRGARARRLLPRRRFRRWAHRSKPQCDERTFDGLVPWPDVRTAVAPFAPAGLGALQCLKCIDRGRRRLNGRTVCKDEGDGLAGFHRELTERSQVLAIKGGRGSQDQTLRSGNRLNRAVV